MSNFKWNDAVLNRVRQKTMEALIDLGEDTAHKAQQGAPVLTGALVNSIRISEGGDNTIYVLAGGTASGYNVPYARRREYENPKNPNSRFYMKNALQWAYDNREKYFKGVTK